MAEDLWEKNFYIAVQLNDCFLYFYIFYVFISPATLGALFKYALTGIQFDTKRIARRSYMMLEIKKQIKITNIW